MAAVKLFRAFLGLVTASAAFAGNAELWIKIDRGTFAFSIPVTCKQIDVQGIDSDVEQYVDSDAGVELFYDSWGMPPAAAQAERQTIRIGAESATILTRPAPSKETNRILTTLVVDREPQHALVMTASCRDASAVALAHRIFATFIFPPGSDAGKVRAPESDLKIQRLVEENRRALLFRVSRYETIPPAFPQSEGIQLALKNLRILDRKQYTRLAIQLLDHPENSAVLAAGDYLVWAGALPADRKLLCHLLDALEGKPSDYVKQVTDALVALADLETIPCLKRAAERDLDGAAAALGLLGGKECFELILKMNGNNTSDGLRNLVLRSNKPLEDWMTESNARAARRPAKGTFPNWEDWWKANQADFFVIHPPGALKAGIAQPALKDKGSN